MEPLSDNFTGKYVGKDKIDLSHHGNLQVMRPIELYIKQNGTKDDKPSLCIVMQHPFYFNAVGEVSLKMFNDALIQAGYNPIQKT